MASAALSSPVPDRRRIAARLLGAAGVLALLGVALTSLPGLGEVRTRLADASPAWLGGALALELASCLAFVVAYRGVLRHRLGWRRSYDLGMAVQGANVLVPAGGASGLALGAWALRRAGVPADRLAPRTVAFFLVTSSVNFFTAIVSGTLLSLGVLHGDASLALTAGPAALAAAAVAIVLALPRLIGEARPRTGRLGRALSAAQGALGEGVAEARALVAAGRPAVIGGAIGYMAFDLAALAAAFAAVGAMPPLGVFMLAYVLGQLGGLIPLPGGIGGADSGVIGALALYGTPLADAAAAVLAYRVFQLGLPALLGTVALLRLPGAVSSGADVVTLPARPRQQGLELAGSRAAAWS
jgi:uncharacterized membrane protein YbhN (UPF0104 family)